MRLTTLLLLAVSLCDAAIKCRECEGVLYLRSRAAVKTFQRSTGFAKGRKGFVVDHVVPLACAAELGVRRRDLDTPSNMQWQSQAQGKLKDKWERRHCRDLQHDPKFDPFKP